jgi:hypothetical protein
MDAILNTRFSTQKSGVEAGVPGTREPRSPLRSVRSETPAPDPPRRPRASGSCGCCCWVRHARRRLAVPGAARAQAPRCVCFQARRAKFFTNLAGWILYRAGDMAVRTVGMDIASLLPKPKGPSSRCTPASPFRSRPLGL